MMMPTNHQALAHFRFIASQVLAPNKPDVWVNENSYHAVYYRDDYCIELARTVRTDVMKAHYNEPNATEYCWGIYISTIPDTFGGNGKVLDKHDWTSSRYDFMPSVDDMRTLYLEVLEGVLKMKGKSA